MKPIKKINILMISSSSSLGGGTKQMFMLGVNMDDNFQVYYAIPKNKNFSKYLNIDNHIEIAERSIKFKDIISLRNFIRANSIDIIHAHGKGAGVLARLVKLLTKKPLVYTFHGIHLQCHNNFKKLSYIFYEYLFGWIDSCKILVSNSERSYAEKSKIYLGNNSIIINNGVPNKLKINYRDRNKLDLKSKKSVNIRVITTCRFVEQKNIKDILRIALKLPNIDFYIIGDGPIWKEIKKIIFEREIKNVNLLGKKKNIFKYLYLSDIYLSTSLYEGLPISILEAMSIGLPILASNVIGNCDTIEYGKSGFLYELKNLDMAVNYLQKLSKSKTLREKLGNSAFNRQRKIFSKKYMVYEYMKIYKKQVGPLN